MLKNITITTAFVPLILIGTFLSNYKLKYPKIDLTDVVYKSSCKIGKSIDIEESESSLNARLKEHKKYFYKSSGVEKEK